MPARIAKKSIVRLPRTNRRDVVRLYTNENFPQPAVERLRALGHDVQTSNDAGNSGRAMPDEEVLDHAIRQRRALVTLNRRHFVVLHERRPEHWGIVVCTVDPDFGKLADRIHAALAESVMHQGSLLRVNRPAR